VPAIAAASEIGIGQCLTLHGGGSGALLSPAVSSRGFAKGARERDGRMAIEEDVSREPRGEFCDRARVGALATVAASLTRSSCTRPIWGEVLSLSAVLIGMPWHAIHVGQATDTGRCPPHRVPR
jgi:hypothetical protein